MSLQTRFAILFAVIGLTALMAVAIAFASFELMSSEVREPFRRMSTVLADLGHIKQPVEELGSIVNRSRAIGNAVNDPLSQADASIDLGVRAGPAGTPTTPPTVSDVVATRNALRELNTELVSLRDADFVATLVGKSTLSNLETRAKSACVPLRSWITAELTPVPPGTTSRLFHAASQHGNRQTAARDLYELHNLIERVEHQIVNGTDTAITYALDMRTRLFSLLLLAVAVTALTAFLGLILIRRWVLRPVERLRIAAGEIAVGNFAHRIPDLQTLGRDELSGLSREINHMSDMVKAMQDERVDRERLAALGEMIRRLAHNLRNPLAGIRGLAELSKADLTQSAAPLAEPVRAELIDHQQRIIVSVDRFEQWLADLLRATKPAQINISKCRCAEWLTAVVDAYRPSATAKGVQLDLDTSSSPTTALVDPSHLEHALGALISNALEAASTSENAPRRVLVRSQAVQTAESENPKWVIDVADSGPGVPPDLRPRIFAPYFTTKRDGSGIGLASALQVIRAHGGTITLETAPENGFSAPNGLEMPNYPSGALFRVSVPTECVVAKDDHVARIGQSGALRFGQNADHRG